MALSDSTRRKVPRLSFLGTPVHPPLTYVPATFLMTGPAFDAAGRVSGDERLGLAGFWQGVVAVAAAGPTAVTGLLDWLRLPAGADGKTLGLIHAGLNTAALGAAVAGLLRRLDKPSDPDAAALGLGALAAGIVGVSAHLGGELAYKHGIRAERSQPLRDPAEGDSSADDDPGLPTDAPLPAPVA